MTPDYGLVYFEHFLTFLYLIADFFRCSWDKLMIDLVNIWCRCWVDDRVDQRLDQKHSQRPSSLHPHPPCSRWGGSSAPPTLFQRRRGGSRTERQASAKLLQSRLSVSNLCWLTGPQQALGPPLLPWCSLTNLFPSLCPLPCLDTPLPAPPLCLCIICEPPEDGPGPSSRTSLSFNATLATFSAGAKPGCLHSLQTLIDGRCW